MIYDIEHPDITAMQRYGYPTWAISYAGDQCDDLMEYIEEEKCGDRIPGGWNGKKDHYDLVEIKEEL